MVQQYFQSGRTTKENGLTSYDCLPYSLPASHIDGALEHAKAEIDRAKSENAWVNLYLHGVHPTGRVLGNDGVNRYTITPDDLTEIIQHAKVNDVEVVSYEEALQTFAPIFYWVDENAKSPLVIKRDGALAYDVQDVELMIDPNRGS